MRSLLVVLLTVSLATAGELEINPHQRLLEEQSGQARLGKSVSRLAYRATSGDAHRVSDHPATAFIFLSTSCPLAKRYTTRLNRLHDHWSSQNVAVVGVFSNAEDSREDVVQHAQTMQFRFPVVKDDHAYLARQLNAKMTPQAIVIDQQGAIRYRGAIDDNRYENRVKQRYLQDALEQFTNGSAVARAQTKTMGCSIHFPEVTEETQITYTQHVARILQDNCQSCHRDGQVAPFALTNYQQAKTWAAEVQHYTAARLMPPWKAAPGFGDFLDARSLSEEQIDLLRRWVAADMPEGPADSLPPTPTFPAEWAVGEPDFIVEMPEEYTIGPEGEDDYRHFIIPTNFDSDRYVSMADVIPGNRQTVHHVIAYVDVSGKARELDAADPGPGYSRFGGTGFQPVSTVAGWAPGANPQPSPHDTGFWLPKGADIVMQVHYYRTGKEEKDRTKLGLYFTKTPQPKKIETAVAINQKFVIEPNDERYLVEASTTLPRDAYALSVSPHMHLLGKEMKVVAKLPSGEVVPMIWIKDWDFNWQQAYRFREPLLFPKGTRIEVTAYFDNSESNPHNPHSPPQHVGWGEKTTDEMCIAFVACVDANQWQPQGAPPQLAAGN